MRSFALILILATTSITWIACDDDAASPGGTSGVDGGSGSDSGTTNTGTDGGTNTGTDSSTTPTTPTPKFTTGGVGTAECQIKLTGTVNAGPFNVTDDEGCAVGIYAGNQEAPNRLELEITAVRGDDAKSKGVHCIVRGEDPQPEAGKQWPVTPKGTTQPGVFLSCNTKYDDIGYGSTQHAAGEATVFVSYFDKTLRDMPHFPRKVYGIAGQIIVTMPEALPNTGPGKVVMTVDFHN